MFSYIGAALQDTASGWLIDVGRTVQEVPVDVDMGRLTAFCGAMGTDLSILVGPDRCAGTRTIAVQKIDYAFTDPFLFWIGASVLSLLLALAVWKAVDRARGRIV